MKTFFSTGKCVILCLMLFSMTCCEQKTASLTAAQQTKVRQEVKLLADSIARNISGTGAVAWLQYFEDTPDFFMASDGKLAFPDFKTAKDFISKNLMKNIIKINLQWHNIRIDPLSVHSAILGSDFHEDITGISSMNQYDGYFTGIVDHTNAGWKLRNAHWSMITK